MGVRGAEVALLRLLSRRPARGRYPSGDPAGVDDALGLLTSVFPGFLERVKGKTVVDFGSGEGFQTLALARAGARLVVGLEINGAHRVRAAAMAAKLGLDNAVFCERVEPESEGTFDIVLSQNSMEHFPDPEGTMCSFRALIHPGGRVCITFSPPWYSLYGAHTAFFCKVPWIHLLFSESAVMAVRAGFTDDGATRYEGVRGGLNRMSLRRFERLVERSGLRPTYESYPYVLGMRFLHGVPLLRELLLYQVNVELAPV